MEAIKQIPQMLELARDTLKLGEELAGIEPRLTEETQEFLEVSVNICRHIESILKLSTNSDYANHPNFIGNLNHDLLTYITSLATFLAYLPEINDFAASPAHMAKLKEMMIPFETLLQWKERTHNEAYPPHE